MHVELASEVNTQIGRRNGGHQHDTDIEVGHVEADGILAQLSGLIGIHDRVGRTCRGLRQRIAARVCPGYLLVAIEVGPVRPIGADESRDVGSPDGHRRDRLRGVVTQGHVFGAQLEGDTARQEDRIEEVELYEPLGTDQRMVHVQVHRLSAGLDLEAERIDLAVAVKVRVLGRGLRGRIPAEQSGGFRHIDDAATVTRVVGVQYRQQPLVIDRRQVGQGHTGERGDSGGVVRIQSGQLAERDDAVAVRVEQRYLLTGKLRGAGELDDREERQTVDAGTRHVELDFDPGSLQRHVIDAHQADIAASRGAHGDQLGRIQRIRRLHDRHTEVQVVEHESHRFPVGLSGDDLAVGVAIDLVIVVGVYPVRSVQTDEGVDIRGADGHERQLFRGRVHRVQRTQGQAEHVQEVAHRQPGIRQQPAAHGNRVHGALLEREAAGDEHELRNLHCRLGDDGEDARGPDEIQVHRRRHATGAGLDGESCRYAAPISREARGEVDDGGAAQAAHERLARIELDLYVPTGQSEEIRTAGDEPEGCRLELQRRELEIANRGLEHAQPEGQRVDEETEGIVLSG